MLAWAMQQSFYTEHAEFSDCFLCIVVGRYTV